MNYLYNGIESIALPEWDIEKYPCVVLAGIHPESPTDADPISMYAFPEVKYNEPGVFSWRFITCEPNGNYFTAYVFRDEWIVQEPSTLNNTVTLLDDVFWTNTDLHNEDGTLYLAASDPVPVNPAAPIDPKSMLMGWIVGRRIAGQRDKSVPPYNPIEYTQFDGTQYIDTGIICNQDTTIEVEFMRDNKTAYFLYGASSDGNTASVTAYLSSGAGNWRFGATYSSQNISADTKYTSKMDKSGITRNGTLSNYGGTVGTFATPVTLALGCNHGADGSFGATRFVGKVYAFRIYDGDKLVLAYIPASKDGVDGFWDSVSRKFMPLLSEG